MLTASCENCGRPSPVSLASPDVLTCPCGWSGPPGPAVRAAIERALAQLGEVRARRDQAGRGVRKAGVTRMVESLRVWNAVIVLVGTPLVVIVVALMFMDDVSPPMFGFCAGPMFVLLPMMGAAVLWTRWANQRPTAMPHAVPPEAPNAPPRCHVCGAPVSPVPGLATARCAFCECDNVLDSRALEPQQTVARTEAQHAATVSAFARSVERSSFSIRSALALASLASALIGPPLGCILGMLVSSMLD